MNRWIGFCIAFVAVSMAVMAAERSGKWHAVREHHIEAHPECAVCGRTDGCEVHHVQTFSLYPERECDPSNLITLCRRHHIEWGHLGDYNASNPLVRQEAERHRAMVKARPYTREQCEAFTRRFQTESK